MNLLKTTLILLALTVGTAQAQDIDQTGLYAIGMVGWEDCVDTLSYGVAFGYDAGYIRVEVQYDAAPSASLSGHDYAVLADIGNFSIGGTVKASDLIIRYEHSISDKVGIVGELKIPDMWGGPESPFVHMNIRAGVSYNF
jgi:hypothetical protein